MCKSSSARCRARRAFERQNGQARHCYGLVLRDESNAKGKLVIEVDVGANGTVADIGVRADRFDGRWLGCMRLKSWTFGVQTAPSKVRYTLVFLPET